jgi:hypothetical protein
MVFRFGGSTSAPREQCISTWILISHFAGGVGLLLEEGGSQAWKLDPGRVRKLTDVVIRGCAYDGGRRDRVGRSHIGTVYFSGNFLVEVAVPRLELPGPKAVTLI